MAGEAGGGGLRRGAQTQSRRALGGGTAGLAAGSDPLRDARGPCGCQWRR
jgi:hypothetical protein